MISLLKLVQTEYAHPGALMMELENPRIWDMYPFRRGPKSPHRELSDIWVRYNAVDNYGDHFNDEHESVWYPVVEEIPTAKEISQQIAKDFSGSLGGVLITKIPAHKRCYPHIDQGWHADYYEKFAYQVQGNTEQSFNVESETLRTRSGDLFWFDNAHLHWVDNPSDEDRITMVVCIRRIH
jgi:aspartyl/asparaginyl beta-hydroxylase